MKILVCNDDGVFSDGIIQLAYSMSQTGKVIVAAPDEERSATGHAITLHKPLRIKQVKLPKLNVEAYSVSGTPADCVKIGIDVLMDRNVDMVVSGINRGANLGTDVLYSGTVSAAIEGCILGVPSIAMSITSYDATDFSYAGDIAKEISKKLIQHGLPSGTLLNINVPAVPESQIRGIRITRLGVRKYAESYIKRLDPRGNPYYWLSGEAVDDTQKDTDIVAINDNYVSITPIHYNLTMDSYIDIVADWFKEKCDKGG